MNKIISLILLLCSSSVFAQIISNSVQETLSPDIAEIASAIADPDWSAVLKEKFFNVRVRTIENIKAIFDVSSGYIP